MGYPPPITVHKVAEGVKLRVLSSFGNQFTKTLKIRSFTKTEAVGAVQCSCAHTHTPQIKTHVGMQPCLRSQERTTRAS